MVLVTGCLVLTKVLEVCHGFIDKTLPQNFLTLISLWGGEDGAVFPFDLINHRLNLVNVLPNVFNVLRCSNKQQH